jgi:hypothetical protein
MIVASLLLILVAVALLALGLTGGSSMFLISSIVASLLAAVALVIGARQAASARRATAGTSSGDPLGDSGGPGPASAASDFPGGARSSAAPDSSFSDRADYDFVETDFSDQGYSDSAFAEEAAFAARHDDTVLTEPVPAGPGPVPAEPMPAEPAAGDLFDDEQPPWAQRDADPRVAGPQSETQQFQAPPFETQAVDEQAAQAARAPEPDYNRASSAINSARSESPAADAWRRPPAEDDVPAAGLVEDFGEPDADDPDDEPLPQSVRPSDAVRVARLDDEVMVVDGRPRYHMADCSHLVGRLTEPIPVNEAVELGFSPCGLCRPVDRLVAAAARR